ncbi:MAG: RHS repeat-associated core domain-containing protein, partial [Silanimonas sp.]|nr:RHS repeat-associated core domain-containing protein [Silanimonas sp.]
SNTSGNTYFVYNENAQLIGEYDNAGARVQEIVWLGNLPIGVIAGTAAVPVLHYIESDHIGTPRVIVDATRNVGIWRWNQTNDPFGESTPNQNPDGDTTSFTFNLRFAGQYRDSESGWYYNVHRYYDPATGRYLESDPIGLGGGISTYGYSASTPLVANDPLGLACNAQGCWVTPTELAYALSGNYGLYYQAACSGGDAYACRAREVSMGRPGLTSLTGVTNARLGASMFERIDGEMSCDDERRTVEQQMERVRRELAMAHADALINSGASPESPAKLTREQIGDFHRDVFSRNGASPDVFGGSTYDKWGGAVGRWYYDWCPSPSCSP